MTTNLLIIFGGMALFVTIIGVIDLIGQRQERKASRHSQEGVALPHRE